MKSNLLKGHFRWALIALAVVGVGAKLMKADEPTEIAEPEMVLRRFLKAVDDKDFKGAYRLIAPSTIEDGDPIAYRAKVTYESFVTEASAQSGKFATYKIGKQRYEEADRFRVFIHFKGGDNDESLLVRTGGKWYVADPIHIIR